MDTEPSKPFLGKRILLGVCGGIAAYKSAELVRLFKKAGADVQVLMSPEAHRFVTPLTLGTLSENKVLDEVFPENSQGSWTEHINLAIESDLLVIAPATANTLSKLAEGRCDSMLTAVALAARMPILLCPSMDHDMYVNPTTQRNLKTLDEDGYLLMEPDEGELASGLIGKGRLPEPIKIFEKSLEIVEGTERNGSLSGKRVLVSAGPTRESIDPVRFISNRSTGTMGFELAREAATLGAEVILVAGPCELRTPNHVERIEVESAAEMKDAILRYENLDFVVMAAAVADFTPTQRADQKISKGEKEWSIPLSATTDILETLGKRKIDGQILVGFAMETQDGLKRASAKLKKKNLDFIALNNLHDKGAGFGKGTNKITLISADGSNEEIPVLPKREVAKVLWNRIVKGLRD